MQWSQIFAQNGVFCLPHLHSTPPLGGFPSEYCHPVWCGKTRLVWLSDAEKCRRYIYSFWHDSRMWQTHSRTDRHRTTAQAALMHSIARKKNYRLTGKLIQKIEKQYTCLIWNANAAVRWLCSVPLCTHARPLLQQLHWLPVCSRIQYKLSSMIC